jgi:rsbT co-antagonist protein RsbR
VGGERVERGTTCGEWLTEVLAAHEDQLAMRWVEIVAMTLRGRLTEAELGLQVRELLGALRRLAAGDERLDLTAESASELRAILAELSFSRARTGFSSTETAISVFALKDALLASVNLRADAEALRRFVEFSQLVDKLGLFTFESYARAREELISEQAQQLLELSTPVVKLWHGVLAVPLVGTLDSARAQVVMEKLLQTLVDTGSTFAIIDITGVSAVDTQVAQHILKTVVAARLMGAECMISGISPQIAQTIVALGIEFGDIATKATLADALAHAMRAGGAEVVRRAPDVIGNYRAGT